MANTVNMKVVLDAGAYMPERAHDTDAGYDLRSPIDIWIQPRDSVVIDTGIHVAIPKFYYGRIASKSGLNMKSIVTEGVIDSAYTGSIRVKMYNHGLYPYHVLKGDKITQMIIERFYALELEQVDELEKTERGNGGFGSTGR